MTDDEVLRAKYEHEFKPLGEHIAGKLGELYGMRLEWEPQPHPKPIVNPREAAYLRAVGLPDELFDVSPPAERNGHDPDTPVWP